jgi:mitochondrial import receptor subunit TOM40
MEEVNPGRLSFLKDNAVAATFADAYAAFSERRKALNLTNPGTVDNIAAEVQKDLLCTNYMFQGLRADLQKVFSIAPQFRIQHHFQMGPTVTSPYNLMALYGTSDVSISCSRACHV